MKKRTLITIAILAVMIAVFVAGAMPIRSASCHLRDGGETPIQAQPTPEKEHGRSPDWDGGGGIIEQLGGDPLLANGGFEGGWHLETAYWTLEGGPFHDQFIEITPPEYWTAWWYEGFPCADGSLTRRPEVRVISTIPDAGRVRSGGQAVQWFTFWGCHSGGLYQQVSVEPGRYYEFSIYAHSWFSNCDLKPHHPLPLDYDCDTDDPILWAQDWLRVCIDPTGGIDPLGPAVECGPAQQIYGVYGEALESGRIQAQEAIITVFVWSETSHPLKHADFYLDDAALRDTTHRIFLPATMGKAR